MDVEIDPEPAPDEREAVVRALAELERERDPRESAWWRAGIEENVGSRRCGPA